MNKHFLSRRQFNALCAAVGLSSVPAGAMAPSGTSVLAADVLPRTVKLLNGAIVPAIGQGSARLGQGRHPETAEEEALRTGISLGMSLIDTSGNYGNGRSEKLIGRAIPGQRDRVFLVSKVEANEVSGDGMARSCQASLSRLGTNFLDLYLLHWPVPNSQFSDVVVSNNYARRRKSKPGACPTLTLTRWKISFLSPTAIAVRPIRFLTASTTEVLSVTF
jgi:hypothetical protein